MKYILILLPAFLPLFLPAQPEDEIQRTINDDVWKPFLKAYAAFDTEAFMAVHTRDVIRINRDGKHIVVGEEYRENQEKSNRRNRDNQVRRTIEFRFTERFVREDLAYEVGYYKVRSSKGDEEERIFYGEFQVILKKQDGKWKLFVDADTSYDGSLTEEDFQRGSPME